MTTTKFDVSTFNLELYNRILDRGLCHGVGHPDGQMCIEAAICMALGLPHGDDPKCVSLAVRAFKISLNDSTWHSPAYRAKGLHDLGLAQLGSLDVVDDLEFAKRMADKTVRVLIPKLLREAFPTIPSLLVHADRCEAGGTRTDAHDAGDAIYNNLDTSGRYTSEYAQEACIAAANAVHYLPEVIDSAAYSAQAPRYADKWASYAPHREHFYNEYIDKFKLMAAGFAMDILRELGSPGMALLEGGQQHA